MSNSADILVAIVGVTCISAWLSSTYKSGFSYAKMFYGRADRPTFEVDRTKWGKFIASIIIAIICNVVVAMIFTSNVADIALFTLLNMCFISYSLMYFVLLKEVKHKR